MGLSFVVLLGYQTIFVVPKQQEKLKNLQATQIKRDTKETAVTSTTPAFVSNKTTLTDIKEEKSKIKTTSLDVELTNVGGSLHKLSFSGNASLFPVENLLTVKGLEKAVFVKNNTINSAGVIGYLYEDQQWRVYKSFGTQKDGLIKASIEITNKSKSSRLEEPVLKLMEINVPSAEEHANRNSMLDEFSILTTDGKKVVRKGMANKFNAKDNKTENSSIAWVGFRDHFHMLLIKPQFETKAYENEVLSDNQMSINVKPKQAIGPGETVNYEFTLVAGDQNIEWLKGYNQGFEKIVAFSNWWILDIIAMAIYYTVPFLHAICRNWGLAIILFGILIYGLTYPLTLKSMVSMKKMQQVQPKVAALQKRYKDDPAKLNTEMVDLYKREKVNPLGGCLPFLLQMPIFIALYQALWRAYYFQGKGFLWIKDLTLPDRLFTLPFTIPFLNTSDFNILPLIMAGVMFLQQKISSKNMVITDETQAMQQKMMKYLLPVFMGFVFYKFASGLSLYFTVFYALSTWTQWKTGKSNTAVSREN